MKSNGDTRIFAEGEFVIKFAGDGLLTAELVSESLAGWNGLYGRVPKILGEYHPAFKHLMMVPFIESIDHGSMIARIVARLITKSEDDARAMERDIDALGDIVKQTLLENVSRMNVDGKNVIYAVLGGAVAYGALNLSGYLGKPERDTISNGSGLVINNSAININIDSAKLMEMVEFATKDNTRLTKQTLSALRPAGVLSDGTVYIGGDESNIVVSAETAKIIARTNPDDLKPRIEERRLLNTLIDIRAIDLDKKTSGWAAIVPAISTNRIRLTVADSVKVSTAGSFFGDVTVDVAIDLDGKEQPRKVHLLKISE